MKHCPKCKRTFSDDTLSFCLSDGSLLSAPYDHPSTQRIGGHSTNPHDTLIVPSVSRHHLPTETIEPLDAPMLRPSRAPTLPNSQAPTLKMELARPRSKVKLIAGVVLLLVVAVAVVWYVKFRPAAATTGDPAALAKYTDQLRSKRDAWLDHVFIGQGTAGGLKESPSAADNTQQAWATAQVLVAAYATDRDLPQLAPRLKSGFAYLKSLRRTTPADGWNLYGNENPYTLTEINAWVTLAHIMSLDGKTKLWSDAERQDVLVQIDRDLAELKLRQSDTGGFRPIRDDQPSFTRTYPTIMALWALAEAKRSPTIGPKIGTQFDDTIRKGINWLFGSYKAGQGWVPNPNRVGQTAKFHGLNAQTLLVLSKLESMPEFGFLKSDPTYKMAKLDFLAAKQITGWNADENNSSVPDADVRYPGTEFTAEGSTFLWFPWTLAELTLLAHDTTLSDSDRAAAAQLRLDILNHNAAKLDNYVETANLSYIFAENLVGVSVFLSSSDGH